MKAIVEYTKEEHEAMRVKYQELLDITRSMDGSAVEKLDKSRGYAHYTFSGKVSTALIDALGRLPTGDEVIMLVDGGFSHFGASCRVASDGTFSGRVNTD